MNVKQYVNVALAAWRLDACSATGHRRTMHVPPLYMWTLLGVGQPFALDTMLGHTGYCCSVGNSGRCTDPVARAIYLFKSRASFYHLVPGCVSLGETCHDMTSSRCHVSS